MSVQTGLDFFVQWHLTERCNLHCRHCYQTGPAGNELSGAEVLEGIGEIADAVVSWSAGYGLSFTPGFNVTGGEPLLREDLFAILAALADRSFDVHLLTNGTLVRPETARRLAEHRVAGVQVSLEGPEDIHDHIRGTGSFSAALAGIHALLAAGHTVTMNVTLSEANADSFTDMVDLARSLGVQKLGFSRLVPSGRGASMLPLALAAERVEEIYRDIFSLTIPGLLFVTGDPIASCLRSQMADQAPAPDGKKPFPVGGCAAGLCGLTVLPDGTLLPCRRLPLPIGNIRTDSVREVWATSVVLARLRDKSSYQGKCGSCPRWSVCRGCRAIAWTFSRARGEGDFLAEDPQCFLN